MFKIGDKVKLNIVGTGYSGEGVARENGMPVFVVGALEGEQAKAQITEVKKSYARAKAIEIVKASPNRVEPQCPYFFRCNSKTANCGGCSYQHINFESECRLKRARVADCLKKIAGLEVSVNECVSVGSIYEYRNKISVAVRKLSDKVCFVLFEEGSHNNIEIESCSLVEPNFFKVLNIIKEFLITNRISIYSDKTGKGLVRHIVLRKLGETYQITIVVSGNNLPSVKDLETTLNNAGFKFSLYLNINKQKTSLITTPNYKFLAGEQTLTENILGLNLRVTPASFLQVNKAVQSELYKSVLGLVDGEKLVVDAYAGAGALTVLLAKQNKQVIGIEIVVPAVEAANALAKENNITNLLNYVGDAAEVLPSLKLQNYTLILDPPRSGISQKMAQAVASSAPNKIVYISCDEATLARDIKLINELSNEAYQLKSVTPYNMFPRTKHIETLAVLIKKQL